MRGEDQRENQGQVFHVWQFLKRGLYFGAGSLLLPGSRGYAIELTETSVLRLAGLAY